jgi:hypothetical protein
MTRRLMEWALIAVLCLPMAMLPACGSDDPVQVVDDGVLGGEETRRPAVPTPKKNSDGTYDIPDVFEGAPLGLLE